MHEHQGTEPPAPIAVYTWRGTGPIRLVTLLYPTPPGQECPIVALAAPLDPADTGVALTLADGATLMLDEADYPLA